MAHEEYQELMTAQALSALDESDAGRLELHLASCPECRAAMEEWEKTSAWLAMDAPLREPSREVRTRILNQIKSDPGQPAKKTKVIQMPERRGTRSTLQRWGSIAAALMILALGIALIFVLRENRRAKNERDQLAQQIQESQQKLARQREVLTILSSSGARVAELAGTGVAPSARGMVAYDQNGRAVLMTKSLPAPPAGKAYQLWFIFGGSPMPGKVFKTDSSGEAMMSDQIPREALNASVFAITLEPETGVAKPTGEIYLKSGS
jgi:anti-sigma-K factor RskA